MNTQDDRHQAHERPQDAEEGAQTLLRLLRIAKRLGMDVLVNEMTHEGSAGGHHRPSMSNGSKGTSSG